MTEKEQRIREVAMIALPTCLSLSDNRVDAVSLAIEVGKEFEKQFSEKVEVPISPRVSTNQFSNTTSTM